MTAASTLCTHLKSLDVCTDLLIVYMLYAYLIAVHK